MSPEALLDLVDHPDIRTATGLEEALAMAEGTTFVSGSLFLVGEVEQLFPERT
jgi:hypothetical protein